MTSPTPNGGAADEALLAQETADWIESLEDVRSSGGPERAGDLLRELQIHAQMKGITLPVTSRTPYVNTIAPADEPEYPGDRDLERRIKSLVRWNAMAMVVRANREASGIGGHISSFASSATLYEVAFNHFFRGKDDPCGGDCVYFQGHSAPGIYARGFLEGRFGPEMLENFRRELAEGGGLSSYPHPWLMPEYWEYPTVSMGLGPIMAIYHARFLRYLENRGLKQASNQKVWCFLGDGETDEPESLGAISLAAREKLDNLIFVVNCNLQRLDGPVRGNGKIVQELEAVFRGVGWNVVKCLWGSEWDPLFAADTDGILTKNLGEVVDGEYQKYRVEGGGYIREKFFGRDPRLAAMVADMTDDQIFHMRMGGHDPQKVYAAYHNAWNTKGLPTVVLAKTIKGYGLGEAGEGKNVTHQQKKLNEEELQDFRDRFSIPISRKEVGEAPFYRPPDDSPEVEYMLERRRELGGFVPSRRAAVSAYPIPEPDLFQEFREGTGDRSVSTTMAFVRMLTLMLRDERMGRMLVPIVPDEARTFGMESMFREFGIYSSVGQLYEPVDAQSLLFYKEAKDGQILQEGLTEDGSMSSFIAAGTAHANHGVCTIPVFLFYSMFGLQRTGDLVWAAGDIRTRGFLAGATAGRTTLSGEGLQHQDGHSHLLALSYPNLRAYDPAFAFEIAVIVHDGIRRMVNDGEDVVYYLTICNENYKQPAMPGDVSEGILRGLYRYREGTRFANGSRTQLIGSGPIMNEVIAAAEILEGYEVEADIWSLTSWKALREEALDVERWNRLNPGEEPKRSWLEEQFMGVRGPFVFASDYVKALPDSLARWVPGRMVALGTEGLGRSDTREDLRDFFEVDARHIAYGALHALVQEGRIQSDVLVRAKDELKISGEKPNPRTA